MQSNFWRISLSASCRLRKISRILAPLALVLAMVVASSVPGGAQQGGVQQTLDQIQQFVQQQSAQQQNPQQPQNATPPAVSPNQTSTNANQPAGANANGDNQTQLSDRSPPSRLEEIMSQRAGVRLRQFGYDQLGTGHEVTLPQVGAVQDDYVLGPGDEVVVTLRGQENTQYNLAVDRNGQMTMPRMNPMGVSGRTFGSVRQELQDAVRRSYVATQAFVTLGQVRQVSVLVTGEVNIPGLRTLSGLASAVDAIMLSGGIKKTGSLRNVRIERQGRQFTVDLYGLLTDRSGPPGIRLADGDRILVPPLGRTVAVTGLVRRPGIFELAPRQSSISARDLLDLAGGQEVRGVYRFSVLRILANGRLDLVPLQGDNGTINDSEILFVQQGAAQTGDQWTLSGATGLAGQYPITTGTKLSDVLKAPGAMGAAPYTPFGLIVRRDPRTLMRTLVPFTPVAVLNGGEDEAPRSDDFVRIFQVREIQIIGRAVSAYRLRRQADQEAIRNPLSAEVATAPANGADATGQNSTSQGATAEVLAAQTAQNALTAQRDLYEEDPLNPSTRTAAGIILNRPSLTPPSNDPAINFESEVVRQGEFPANREINSFIDLAHQLQVDPIVLVNFLMDHQATLDGAVRGPGDYFIGPNVSLQDLVQAAGGTLNWADQSGIELISTTVDAQSGRSETSRVNLPLRQSMLANYIVRPHDSLRFNQVFSNVDVGNVTLQGEVRFPGTYAIVRGEHLSDLLMRAGGLTNTAYPYGTVFLRKSAAAVEHDGYVRMAQEIESQLLIATPRLGSVPIPASQIQAVANQLRNQKALGRIAIVADPSVLASRPELDPLLESGDVLYIPQRPSTIAVLGQVMQQGSYRYEAGRKVKDYIEEAGGYAQASDEDNTFVVLPDGSARKVDVSWLNFDSTALPPGSAIVVPRDLVPFDLRQALIDSTQILGQLSQFAVTAASLAVLAKQ